MKINSIHCIDVEEGDANGRRVLHSDKEYIDIYVKQTEQDDKLLRFIIASELYQHYSHGTTLFCKEVLDGSEAGIEDFYDSIKHIGNGYYQYQCEGIGDWKFVVVSGDYLPQAALIKGDDLYWSLDAAFSIEESGLSKIPYDFELE